MPIIVDPILTPGAGVDLCAVFLNTAGNPSDFRAFEHVGDALNPTTTVRAEVRQLANRRRLIRRGTITGDIAAESYVITLPRCTSADVVWLRAHVGILLCVRDHKGSKFYGAYLDVPREIQTGFPDRTGVKITVDEVTYSESA